MVKHFLLFPALLLYALCSNSQQAKSVNHSTDQYSDFVVKNDTIWALTTSGDIRLLRADNGNVIPAKKFNAVAVTHLAMDKQGNIVVGDKLHAIKKYDQGSNTWVKIASDANELFGITFDSNNNCFLLTDKGVVDVSAHKIYFPDSSLNYITIGHDRWYKKTAHLMDSHDNLWVGFGYGEWGGDLIVFNCKDKKFIPLNEQVGGIRPVKSIFEAGERIIVTIGLAHLSMMRGQVLQFDQFNYKCLFNSSGSIFHNEGEKEAAGEYIGPGCYNPIDKCIYFYSQNGIFKGDPEKDLSEIEYWEKIAQPKLKWAGGQPDAAGLAMNVLKMTIDNAGRLFFLSKRDGIGILKGDSL